MMPVFLGTTNENQYIEFGKRSTIDASLFNFLVPTIRKQQVWTPRTLREIATSRCSSMFYAFGSLVWSFLNDVLLFCFSDAWHGLFPLDCLLTIVYLPNTWSQYARDRLPLLTARRWQMTSSWPLVQATGPWAEFGTWAWRKPGLTVWSDDSSGTFLLWTWHLCLTLTFCPNDIKPQSYKHCRRNPRKVLDKYQGVMALYLRFTWKTGIIIGSKPTILGRKHPLTI